MPEYHTGCCITDLIKLVTVKAMTMSNQSWYYEQTHPDYDGKMKTGVLSWWLE